MTAPSLGFGPTATEPNPCVRLWGPGPEGAKCRTCTLLVVHWSSGRRYYKCKMRRISASEATDHRIGWRACAKYEEDRDE